MSFSCWESHDYFENRSENLILQENQDQQGLGNPYQRVQTTDPVAGLILTVSDSSFRVYVNQHDFQRGILLTILDGIDLQHVSAFPRATWSIVGHHQGRWCYQQHSCLRG